MSVCVSVLVSVCVCVCVHDNSKNNGSIHLKLEHIVVYEIARMSLTLGIVRSRSVTHHKFKIFSIYHNINCQVLYLRVAKKLESCD